MESCVLTKSFYLEIIPDTRRLSQKGGLMNVLEFIQNMLNDIFPEGEYDGSATFQDLIDGDIDELTLTHFLYAIELEYKVNLPETLTDNPDMVLNDFAKEVEKLSPSDDPMFRYNLLKTVSDEIAACYFDEDFTEE